MMKQSNIKRTDCLSFEIIPMNTAVEESLKTDSDFKVGYSDWSLSSAKKVYHKVKLDSKQNKTRQNEKKKPQKTSLNKLKCQQIVNHFSWTPLKIHCTPYFPPVQRTHTNESRAGVKYAFSSKYKYTIFNQIEIQIRSYFYIIQIRCLIGMKYKYVFDHRPANDPTISRTYKLSYRCLSVKLRYLQHTIVYH